MKPYYERDGITIFHGHWMEVVADLPLVDCCIVDPPYGETSLEWDSAEVGWLSAMDRTVQASGSIWCFGSLRYLTLLLYKRETPWAEVYKNPITTNDATARTVRRKERPPHTGEIENSSYTSLDGGPRLMRSVIQVRSCHGEVEHPTQKPQGIIDPLIRYSCKPGGIVLDPFMGSGSTLVAAKALFHSAVGIEIEERYCEIAVKRLRQEVFPFS